MSNYTLAAVIATGIRLKQRWMPRARGLCQKAMRLGSLRTYGDSRYFNPSPPSAISAGRRFLRNGLGRQNVPRHKLKAGDLLYKIDPANSGGFGHVGANLKDGGVGGVGENSSYHAARQNGDARGIRTLDQYGYNEDIVVVSLPDPKESKPAPALLREERPLSESVPPTDESYTWLVVNGEKLGWMPEKDGVSWVHIRKLYDELNIETQYFADDDKITIDGKPLPSGTPVWERVAADGNTRKFLPLRNALRVAGYNPDRAVKWDKGSRTVYVTAKPKL